jgi:beta-glucosidase
MRHPRRALSRAGTALLMTIGVLGVAVPQAHAATQPWMNTAQTPLDRANELLAAMTQAEKLTMLHGGAGCGYVGCVDGNTRLGIPPLHLQDGPVGAGDGFSGVTQLAARRPGTPG